MIPIPEDYNPADYDTDFTSTPMLPEGRYLVEAIAVKQKTSNTNQDNKYVQIDWLSKAGNHTGIATCRLNLINNSERSQLMARKELTAILQALGCGRPRQFEDIIGLQLVITVRGEPRTDKPNEMNWEIVQYEPAAAWGGVTSVQQQPAQGHPPQQYQQPAVPQQQAPPASPPQQYQQPVAQQPGQPPAGTPPWIAGPQPGQPQASPQQPPQSGPTF